MRHLFALVLVLPLISGCGADSPTVSLLVADGAGSSHSVDADAFEERVLATCDECSVTVYDAEGDAAQQKSQVRQAEAASADVMVIVPVEPEDLESVTGVEVPLVSLGTLVPGADRHVGLETTLLTTGGGSDLEAARDVILGESESMTYVPTVEMSQQAADVAVGVLADTPVADGEEVEGVESWLFSTQEITLDTLTTVLVGQGMLTLADLCAGATETRCEKLGLI